MTYEEAIQWIKEHKVVDEETQESTVMRMAISALGKRVPQEPVVKSDTDGYAEHYECPKCGTRFISRIDNVWLAGFHYRFCYICGQAVDWSKL